MLAVPYWKEIQWVKIYSGTEDNGVQFQVNSEVERIACDPAGVLQIIYRNNFNSTVLFNLDKCFRIDIIYKETPNQGNSYGGEDTKSIY